ncbi:MAG: hypothetical protein ACM3O7_03455 [Acidobacteriota bacterium]
MLTNDGHRIGRIREVGQHFLRVSGHLFSGDVFVPASAISNVEHGAVHLNVASGEVAAMGWQQPPRMPDTLRTSPERETDREI